MHAPRVCGRQPVRGCCATQGLSWVLCDDPAGWDRGRGSEAGPRGRGYMCMYTYGIHG